MPSVTETYYSSTYKGEPVDSADFPGLLVRAQEIVEEMIMYRTTLDTMSNLSKATQERIKKAICAQIEYLNANPDVDIDDSNLQSAGLGRFNYSKAAGANGSSETSVYAPRALRILAPTGLLYRGGGVSV